jgi:hypothetical protein
VSRASSVMLPEREGGFQVGGEIETQIGQGGIGLTGGERTVRRVRVRPQCASGDQGHQTHAPGFLAEFGNMAVNRVAEGVKAVANGPFEAEQDLGGHVMFQYARLGGDQVAQCGVRSMPNRSPSSYTVAPDW